MRSPPGVSMPSTCTYHLPSSPHTTISHGTPETELRTLSSKPQPWPRVGERAVPPTPPCHPPAPTTSHHHLTPPFYAAWPKLSYECSVSGFCHKPCPLPSHWQTSRCLHAIHLHQQPS